MIIQSIVIFFVAYISTCTDDLEIIQRTDNAASHFDIEKTHVTNKVSELQDPGQAGEQDIREPIGLIKGDSLQLSSAVSNHLAGIHLNNAKQLCTGCLKLYTGVRIDCMTDLITGVHVVKKSMR